jgi:hypothetical protein
LLAELERKLTRDKDKEVAVLRKGLETGDVGMVTFEEETASLEAATRESINDLRNAFAVADPQYLTPRVSIPA